MERAAIVSRVLSNPADVLDVETGLYRQSYFQVILSREVMLVRRTGEPFTVGILGIDHRPPRRGGNGSSAASRTDPSALGAIIRKTSFSEIVFMALS